MTLKELLTELIDQAFRFESGQQGDGDYSMQDFLGYMNARMNKQKIEIRKISGEEMGWLDPVYTDAGKDISILLGLMYRYAKGYIKKAMQGSRIKTADEFSFLITLMTFDSLTKTELINKQIMEKTSGSEVLRRLVRQGFIREFSNPDDKRSIRVSITGKGKREILSVLPGMHDASRIIAGNLTEDEIHTLAYLLKKLDYYHNDIFMNRRNATLKELLP